MEEPSPTRVDDPEYAAARLAVHAARQAWAQAIATIERMHDTDAAWNLAGELSDAAQAITAPTGLLRARLARRIRTERRLSLAELASHVGVSKGRAQGWIEAAESGADSVRAATRRLTEDAGREAGVPNSPKDR